MSISIGAALVLGAAALHLPGTAHAEPLPEASTGCYFYNDAVTWDSWTWSASVRTDSSRAWEGQHSMAVTFERGWAGIGLKSSPLSVEPYTHLQFAIRPSGGELSEITASVHDERRPIREVGISPYTTPERDGWHSVSIPLVDLGAPEAGVIHAVQLKDATGKRQSTFHLDGIRLAGPANGETGYAPCDFRPLEASEDVDQAVREVAERYNLPRWFYYAIIQRESSFDPKKVGPRNDLGLTQLKGAYYTGRPYPMGLREPDDGHRDYRWAMNIPAYGEWISMHQVSPMTDPFDPRQNLDRFSTGYAVPAFHLFKDLYGLDDDQALRAVAYHWNKGVYRAYDPNNTDYLALYDKYVAQFKPPVEAEDGVWDGQPSLSPPKRSPSWGYLVTRGW